MLLVVVEADGEAAEDSRRQQAQAHARGGGERAVAVASARVEHLLPRADRQLRRGREGGGREAAGGRERERETRAL